MERGQANGEAGVDIANPEVIRGAVAYVGSLVDEVVKSF